MSIVAPGLHCCSQRNSSWRTVNEALRKVFHSLLPSSKWENLKYHSKHPGWWINQTTICFQYHRILAEASSDISTSHRNLSHSHIFIYLFLFLKCSTYTKATIKVKTAWTEVSQNPGSLWCTGWHTSSILSSSSKLSQATDLASGRIISFTPH